MPRIPVPNLTFESREVNWPKLPKFSRQDEYPRQDPSNPAFASAPPYEDVTYVANDPKPIYSQNDDVDKRTCCFKVPLYVSLLELIGLHKICQF